MFLVLFLAVSLYNVLISQGNVVKYLPITRQGQIDSFSLLHPTCTTVKEWIYILYDMTDTIKDLSGLSQIKEVGTFVIICPFLENLSGVADIEKLYGVSIAKCKQLVNIDVFNKIDSISFIRVVNNETLEHIDGFENVKYINNVYISENPKLKNFHGLNNLEKVDKKSVKIQFNDSLEEIGLKSLKYIGGTMFVGYNNSLSSFVGLENLESIGGFLMITSNKSLGSISGLDNLKEIKGGFWFYNNNEVKDINPLKNLVKINNSVRIWRNEKLENINGLDNVEPSVKAKWNDFSDIEIFYNPSLKVCGNKFLCEVISDPDISAEIFDNNNGCNDADEIKKYCEKILNSTTENRSQKKLKIFPNPAKNLINLEFFINKPGDINVEVTDVLGKKVINLEKNYNVARNYSERIDLNQLKPGFYTVRLILPSGASETKSIIKQ